MLVTPSLCVWSPRRTVHSSAGRVVARTPGWGRHLRVARRGAHVSHGLWKAMGQVVPVVRTPDTAAPNQVPVLYLKTVV